MYKHQTVKKRFNRNVHLLLNESRLLTSEPSENRDHQTIDAGLNGNNPQFA